MLDNILLIMVMKCVLLVLLIIWWLKEREIGIIRCGINFFLFYIGFIVDLEMLRIVIFGVLIIGVK